MYWLATRSAVVAIPKWRSLSAFLSSPPFRRSFIATSPCLLNGQLQVVRCYRYRRFSRGSTGTTKKAKASNKSADDKDILHLAWWKEKLQICRKPSTVQLVGRLVYSNLLGIDDNLKNGRPPKCWSHLVKMDGARLSYSVFDNDGNSPKDFTHTSFLETSSLKEGSLNWEILLFKSKFPREVLLCRVGDFYEAIGIDACILVEYAGLNPFGGTRSDSIPRAGCPVVNLRQTLDDLTRNGYSVCIVEEVQGPAQARCRKGRFISGHAHPGSPYVYGLVGIDHDLEFPEPMPVIGLSHSAGGYSMILVLETMKTYSQEDGLTEDALVTKLRTRQYHHLFLHVSLRQNSSGTRRWGEYGEGGVLWGECNSRSFEWIEGHPVSGLLLKVKELYGLNDDVTFRNVTVPSHNRPRPLHLGTATQIGAIPTEGIPCLLKVLLPSNCNGLPSMYIRDLILNPPPYEIAATIQATCKLMNVITSSIPDFTCVSSAKIVKLLELREANHIEFCRIKNVLEEVLYMHESSDLREILKLLMDSTWVATGLQMDFDTLIMECKWTSCRIGELITLDGESGQTISLQDFIPRDFFEDMESSWKGRVKTIHIDEAYAEVEAAAENLSKAISEDFLPILSRIKATTAPLLGPKGEILYAREHEAVWFKGKRFTPSVWAGTPGEDQIKQLKPAVDSKRRKVGEEWFTTVKVEQALTRYHEACDKAKVRVLDLFRGLSAELQTKINVLVFASMLLVIAKALFAHVSEGRRRKWVFPTLAGFSMSKDAVVLDGKNGLEIVGLSPYWFDVVQGGAVHNTVEMQSLFLLTGPNGGGKSSLLRSIGAAALLGICGLMVPAESATIPHFDSIMLHMKSYDSPADGKSSFQVEMSEIRSIVTAATSRSLVLVDEICRGTETAKGTCIAGSIIETLDRIGCLGIISTHLHGIFSLPLNTKNTVHKAMGTTFVDGQPQPTWKLIDGICCESLAFETAKKEGVPEAIIERAEELYLQSRIQTFAGLEILNGRNCEEVAGPDEGHTRLSRIGADTLHHEMESEKATPTTRTSIERDIMLIYRKKFMELHKLTDPSVSAEVQLHSVAAREQPPPSTIGASVVYVMLRPDKKIYVGQTDDLEGRIRAHRSKEGMQKASFLYFSVSGKSIACQLETLLINQLSDRGFQLTNIADGKHRNFGSSGDSLGSMAVL